MICKGAEFLPFGRAECRGEIKKQKYVNWNIRTEVLKITFRGQSDHVPRPVRSLASKPRPVRACDSVRVSLVILTTMATRHMEGEVVVDLTSYQYVRAARTKSSKKEPHGGGQDGARSSTAGDRDTCTCPLDERVHGDSHGVLSMSPTGSQVTDLTSPVSPPFRSLCSPELSGELERSASAGSPRSSGRRPRSAHMDRSTRSGNSSNATHSPMLEALQVSHFFSCAWGG